MGTTWGSAPRWQVMRDALREAVAANADGFGQTGVVLFPAAGLSPVDGDEDAGVVDGACQVEASAGTGDHLQTTLADDGEDSPYRASASTDKPLLSALHALDELISERGTAAVVLVATGGATCDWDGGDAVTTVANWQLRGATTHVIGLPGVSEDDGRMLDRIAIAGGMEGRVQVANVQEAETALAEILEGLEGALAQTCLFELERAIDRADGFRVAVQLGPDGEREVPSEWWSLEGDNTRVRLSGPICDAVLSGAFDHIELHFQRSCPL